MSLEQAVPKPIYAAVQNSGVVERFPSKSTWPGVEGAHYTALSPDGKQLMVSGFKTGNVYIMDTDIGEIQASFPIGKVVQGVKVSPDGRYGFAVATTLGEIAVIDMETLSLVKKINVGDSPHNIDISEDGRYLYVSVTADNLITVIDLESLQVVRREPVDGKFPFWVAVPGNP
ncbi:YncE family protein [Marinobacter sp.]|uniref:YncE family protein n=1 Tax=Marinobacter sp. TaxID=50741 RepID=UPI003A918F36